MNIQILDIDPMVLQNLHSDCKKNYVSNNSSIFNGNQEKQILANLTGRLGEHFFQELNPNAIKFNTVDYDFTLNHEKIDIKTKRMKHLRLKDFYTVDIPDYQVRNQKTDSYSFFIINESMDQIAVLGKISKKDFIKKSKLFKKDSVVERNGFIYKVDTRSLELKELV